MAGRKENKDAIRDVTTALFGGAGHLAALIGNR